jgi:hypothetical protein
MTNNSPDTNLVWDLKDPSKPWGTTSGAGYNLSALPFGAVAGAITNTCLSAVEGDFRTGSDFLGFDNVPYYDVMMLHDRAGGSLDVTVTNPTDNVCLVGTYNRGDIPSIDGLSAAYTRIDNPDPTFAIHGLDGVCEPRRTRGIALTTTQIAARSSMLAKPIPAGESSEFSVSAADTFPGLKAGYPLYGRIYASDVGETAPRVFNEDTVNTPAGWATPGNIAYEQEHTPGMILIDNSAGTKKVAIHVSVWVNHHMACVNMLSTEPTHLTRVNTHPRHDKIMPRPTPGVQQRRPPLMLKERLRVPGSHDGLAPNVSGSTISRAATVPSYLPVTKHHPHHPQTSKWAKVKSAPETMFDFVEKLLARAPGVMEQGVQMLEHSKATIDAGRALASAF